jgi:7TM-HD extracellular
MLKLRISPAVAVLVAALFFSVAPVHAALPDYKLGDVATEDVITPVQLLVVNPEATEALKQKVAQQVPTIVRRTVPSYGEAEAELRASIAAGRNNFMTAFKTALNGRAPVAADIDSPAYVSTMREVAEAAPKSLPFSRLAPLWVRGASDEPVVASLLQPIREIMAQPIVGEKNDNPLPPNQPVQLIQVQTPLDTPSMQELEANSVTITAGKVISLGRARRVVETYFPSGQAEMGRFAATFVRTNAYPAPGLTEILRAKRMDGVTVNDTYEAAQVIIKKGQVIDRKALSALAAVREKSLIGTLQTKLDQEKTVAGQISQQTKWIAVALGGMGLALLFILWRLRSRPGNALVPITSTYQSLPGSDQPALPGGRGEDDWRSRAMVAEVKAERAQQAIRTGALGWMREKVFQTLFSQRAELLSVQQRAEAEMRELEQRLEQLHTPLQERIMAYEKRIEELEQDLAAKGEENRELIGARINVAKQQLNVERGRFGSN